MTPDQHPDRSTRLRRALRRRCPNCGAPAFETWFRMHPHCEGCGIEFEREPGYWVGAVTINTTVAFAGFVTLFGALVALTWPSVPWGLVLGLTALVNLVVPVVFYPVSKTVWVALDLGWHPLEEQELRAAAERSAG